MPELLREYWKYFVGAIALHVAIAALLTVTISSMPRRVVPQQLAIQATLVDQSGARRTRERERQAEEQRRAQQEAAKQAQEEQAKRSADEETARQQKAEEEKNAKQQQAVIEQQRQADLQKQKQQQAQAAEQQARAAAERQQRDDAEKKRVAEIERKQRDEAAKRQVNDEARQRADREMELRRQLAEEEGRNTAANSGLLNQYIAMIEQRVVRNWNRPPSARPGLECEVKVAQAPGGTVLSVQVGKCNGDTAVMQSIETAVYRSSPLPPPPDPRLFERNLVLIFKPAE